MFLPLCMGGRMIVMQNLFALPRSADAGLVRLINTGPSLLDALLRTHPLPAGTKTVIVAGERLTRGVADRLFAVSPAARLLNCYGPTETTVYSTYAEVRTDERCDPDIGRALANTSLHVIGADGAVVPPGAIGELYIGGAGVSRGYIRRPDLDHEKFLPAPTGAGRMYRTGDLVRWRADGRLDFVSRVDDQIKINGLRVEPGEIEAVLAGVPGIAQAVVILKHDEAEASRLVGYLVAPAAARPDLRLIRAEAGRLLPAHMRPAQYVWIEQLPLTPNGKADRKALPQPPNVRPSRQDRQPETRLEMILAEVWQDVVGSPPAGVSADFLESGGDSLTFLNLLAAIELRLDVSLPMDGLYDTVLADGITIASLATAVMMIDGASRENLFLTVWQSFGEKPPLFLFPGIGGDSLQLRLLARALGQERPLFIFHRRPNDDLGGGLEDLAARCIALMLQRQPQGPFHLGGYSFGASLAYEMARQLTVAGHEVAQVVIVDTICPAWRLTYANALPAIGRWSVKSVDLARRRLQGSGGSLRRRAGHGWRRLRRKVSGLAPHIGTIIDPATISPELAALVNTHIQIAFDYSKRLPGQPLIRVPVAVIRTDANARHYLNAGPALGWDKVSAGAPLRHLVAGNHATIMRLPLVEELAAAIRASLNAVPSEAPAEQFGDSVGRLAS